MKISKLPEAELKVMRYIWEANDVLTSKELVAAMEENTNGMNQLHSQF